MDDEKLETEGFTFFYQGIFSNFFASNFVDPAFYPSLAHTEPYRQADGVRFHNVEQYMHACKALVCGDVKVFHLLMEESDPLKAKKLGRQVTPYNDMLWQGVAREVVTRGCWLKFGQNEEIWKEMDRTVDTLFVECAPRDTRWGIGLDVNNSQRGDPAKWRGTNWLGQCLTLARGHVRGGTEPGLPDLQGAEET